MKVVLLLSVFQPDPQPLDEPLRGVKRKTETKEKIGTGCVHVGVGTLRSCSGTYVLGCPLWGHTGGKGGPVLPGTQVPSSGLARDVDSGGGFHGSWKLCPWRREIISVE